MAKIFFMGAHRAIEPVLVACAAVLFSVCTIAALTFQHGNSALPVMRTATASSSTAIRKADRLCAREDGAVVRCAQPGRSSGPVTVRPVSSESSTAERAPTANEAIENAFSTFDPAYGVTAWAPAPVAR